MRTSALRLAVFAIAVPIIVLIFAPLSLASSGDPATVLVVVGAPGTEEYGQTFARWAGLWEKASLAAGAKYSIIGLKPEAEPTDHDQLQKALHEEPKESRAELWLVLIGHGTFDGKEAKFNVRGPDVSATELAPWLESFHRPLAVINSASSSGPFIKSLSGPGRIVITATKSGFEQNYARFGQYIAEALLDAQADLDKDGQTSLLEAFLTASYRAAEFYKTEGRLATEHALLDDNGDGLGTPADWFRGIRAVKKAQEGASLDGFRAYQLHLLRSPQEQQMPAAARARRDDLELAINQLRDAKKLLPEEEYYTKLEGMLLELARLYEPSGDATRGASPNEEIKKP